MQTATVTRASGTTEVITSVTSCTISEGILTITYTTESGTVGTHIFAPGAWTEVKLV